METLTKISTRVSDLTRRNKPERLESVDAFHSFAPPTFDAYGAKKFSSFNSGIQQVKTTPATNAAVTNNENGRIRNFFADGVRRLSPFPGKETKDAKEQSAFGTLKASVSLPRLNRDPKDSKRGDKYKKIHKSEDDGTLVEKNGIWKLKDSAMNKVDKMKKRREGQYGEQLLDSDDE